MYYGQTALSLSVIKSGLKSDNSYTSKSVTRHVIDIVDRNRSIKEPYCELVHEALLRYNAKVINNDERTEENLFLNNDALDDDSIENRGVSYRVALQILR